MIKRNNNSYMLLKSLTHSNKKITLNCIWLNKLLLLTIWKAKLIEECNKQITD